MRRIESSMCKIASERLYSYYSSFLQHLQPSNILPSFFLAARTSSGSLAIEYSQRPLLFMLESPLSSLIGMKPSPNFSQLLEPSPELYSRFEFGKFYLPTTKQMNFGVTFFRVSLRENNPKIFEISSLIFFIDSQLLIHFYQIGVCCVFSPQ